MKQFRTINYAGLLLAMQKEIFLIASVLQCYDTDMGAGVIELEIVIIVYNEHVGVTRAKIVSLVSSLNAAHRCTVFQLITE